MHARDMKNVISKNIFACLFSVHNAISLSRHEQVCLIRHTCSCLDKLIVLWKMLIYKHTEK